MISTLAMSVVITMTVSQVPIDGDAELINHLHDAYLTNQAATQQGQAFIEVDYKFNELESHLILHEEIVWSHNDKLIKYKQVDPEGLIRNTKTHGSINNQQTSISLILVDKAYNYIAETKRLSIISVPLQDSSMWLVNLIPHENWFRCCPPRTSEGTPYADLVRNSQDQTKYTKHIKIERLSNEIRFTRTDIDGGILDATFSLDHNLNLTSFTYEGPSQKNAGVYKWVKENSSSYLAEYEVTTWLDTNHDVIDSIYQLKVKQLNLRYPITPTTFSPEALIRGLPGETRIEDNINGKIYDNRPTAIDDAEKFDALIEEVKSKGFAADDKQ